MITIFSIPKPFEGHTGIIQRNAITSWTRLEPKCEVVLVGDEAGTSEIARELGIRHIPEIERNEFGTPLWNSYMDHGQDAASYPVVCWVPADTILLSDFLPAASAVIAKAAGGPFLMMGWRWNIDLREAGDFSTPDWEARLRALSCPFNCYFSANSDLTIGPVRARSPQPGMAEIEHLKREYQIEAIAFKDDNAVPINNRPAIAQLEAIGNSGIKWRGQPTANGMHPDMVKLIKEAGGVEIALGIVSVPQDVLNNIIKRFDITEAKEYIYLFRNTGIGVRLNLIIELPAEPGDIADQPLPFLDDADPTSVLLSYLYLVPSSEMFDHPEKFGITINTYDWQGYVGQARRYDGEELPDILFDYDDVTPFGKGMSRETIFQDYTRLQNVSSEGGLNK